MTEPDDDVTFKRPKPLVETIDTVLIVSAPQGMPVQKLKPLIDYCALRQGGGTAIETLKELRRGYSWSLNRDEAAVVGAKLASLGAVVTQMSYHDYVRSRG